MTYQERIDALRALKEAQTQAKLQKNGSMDEDDYGSVLPPEGVEIPIEFNDPVNKTFYGARLWGKNFRALMEHHPVYVDARDALAGRWMYILQRLRPFESATSAANLEMAPVFNYEHLKPLHKKCGILPGIGKMHHFAPDYQLLLDVGINGMLKITEDEINKIDVCDGSCAERYEYFLCCKTELEGLLKMCDSYAQYARELANNSKGNHKKEYMELYEVLKQVPANPTRTFREALQSIHMFTWSLYGIYSFV